MEPLNTLDIVIILLITPIWATLWQLKRDIREIRKMVIQNAIETAKLHVQL